MMAGLWIAEFREIAISQHAIRNPQSNFFGVKGVCTC
jgi:hypothetical protein